jgi:beta-lactamase regulating signal transducer with metallopeptidase domain
MNSILDLSLHGSLAFLLVWVLDRLVASRMHTVGRSWWWITVPLAFLVSIPLSVLPVAITAPIAHEERVWAPILRADPNAEATAGKIGLSQNEIWLWLWLAGAVIYLLVVIVQTRAALFRWSRERLSTDPELLGLLEDCKQKAGITAPIGIVVSDHVFAPALLGWLRPRILLPRKMPASMSPHQLQAVLYHELAHFRSLDIPLNWLFAVVRGIHWFNPLVHVASRGWANFREEAADETAMNWMKPSSPVFYGKALLCAIRESNGGAPPFGALAIGESIHNLKRRITMINQYQNKSSRLLFAGAVLILVITAFVVRPIHADIGDPEPNVTGSTANQVLEVMQHNAEATTSDEPGLQILQAFWGADGSWCDVTNFVRHSVRDKVLKLSLQQPYTEFGGDPAYGRIKSLLVSYRIDGRARVGIFQDENPPIGLRVALP